MRANLGTIPKYRITFTHNSPSDDPAPDDLGLERQPDGGWHLWSGSEAFAGITIPAEAVEHLVAVMSKIRFDPVEDAPEPLSSGGRWTYNAYRATLLRDGLRFAMVTPDGSNALSPEDAGELLVALNGSGPALKEKAPEPPAPAVSPDPGYRIVLSIADLILGCEEPSDRSDSRPMTANIPAESAKALGLTAPGDEAYIEVTEVNSDGSVVVTAEMEDAEDSAPPPPAPAPAAMPEELGKMLGS